MVAPRREASVRQRTDPPGALREPRWMNDHASRPVQPEPFYHEESGAVRFWVRTEAGDVVGASIPRQVLHFRFNTPIGRTDALETYMSHRGVIDAATLRRIAKGSIEPVMLREYDLT
jgi:hypothetical protein